MSAKAEEEKRLRKEAEARAKAAEEARLKAEAESRAKEEAAKRKEEENAREKAAAEAKQKEKRHPGFSAGNGTESRTEEQPEILKEKRGRNESRYERRI